MLTATSSEVPLFLALTPSSIFSVCCGGGFIIISVTVMANYVSPQNHLSYKRWDIILDVEGGPVRCPTEGLKTQTQGVGMGKQDPLLAPSTEDQYFIFSAREL